MNKAVNAILIILILIFFVSIYNYYTSNKNIDTKNYNRKNIDKIITSKISDLPILKNDTTNVIIYNDGFSGEINNDKPRSFWNLLKFK